jgi:hypothetical protein
MHFLLKVSNVVIDDRLHDCEVVISVEGRSETTYGENDTLSDMALKGTQNNQMQNSLPFAGWKFTLRRSTT